MSKDCRHFSVIPKQHSTNQFGFRKGRDIRDATAALQVLYVRILEYNNKVHACYIDYDKAFDRVEWTKLMMILQNIGLDLRDKN